MARVLKVIFWVYLAFVFIFAAWYVLHGDIVFSSDIARDFFLFGEIAQKKIVLIGPRSSTGLFHGPLWTYLNFPAYVIGHGNPIVVGWWWVILSFLFLAPSFYIAKKLFNTSTAYCFTIMLALSYAFNDKGLFNPHGAMFVMPIFFYFFVMYLKEGKAAFLIGTMLSLAALIQFQMADGIPFAILSFFAIVGKIVKTKKYVHSSLFSILILGLGNFILFDVRHQHILLEKVVDFLSPIQKGQHFNYINLLSNRLSLLFSSPEILRRNIMIENIFLFVVTLLGMIVSIKKRQHVIPYLSFLYLYFGFFLLSFLNKGDILYFYLFPLFPLIFLVFTSLVVEYKKLFVPLFAIVIVLNTITMFADIQDANNFFGQNLSSWKFLNTATKKIFERKDTTFGYFVYSPDVVAYEGRYAMQYAVWTHPAIHADMYKKDAITYLFVAPPPSNNPFMHDDWWRQHQLNISQTPITLITYPNGYKVQRLELTKEEQLVPFDPNINPGIAFR